MNEELHMIEKNKTWQLVDRPQYRKDIGVKWVFKTKLNVDDSINKPKARLVLKAMLRFLEWTTQTHLNLWPC